MARKQKQIILDFSHYTNDKVLFDKDHIPPVEAIEAMTEFKGLKPYLLKRRENLMKEQSIKFNGVETTPEELARRLLI